MSTRRTGPIHPKSRTGVQQVDVLGTCPSELSYRSGDTELLDGQVGADVPDAGDELGAGWDGACVEVRS